MCIRDSHCCHRCDCDLLTSPASSTSSSSSLLSSVRLWLAHVTSIINFILIITVVISASVRLWLAHVTSIINFILIITVVIGATVTCSRHQHHQLHPHHHCSHCLHYCSDCRVPTCSIITLSDDTFVSYTALSIFTFHSLITNDNSPIVLFSLIHAVFDYLCIISSLLYVVKTGIFTWFTSCRVIYVFTTTFDANSIHWQQYYCTHVPACVHACVYGAIR